MADAIELERLKLEQYKARLDYDRVNLERERDTLTRQKILFDAVMVFASVAIKAMLLVNGIAAMGLVALLASTYPAYVQNSEFLSAIRSFSYGTIAALLTVGLAYLTQLVYSEAQSPKTIRLWGGGLRIVAIVAAFFSMWCIYAGSSHFLTSFSNVQQPLAVAAVEHVSPTVNYTVTELATAFAPYAWPATSLLLVLFLALFFRGPITLLLQRMTRLNKDGVEFASPQQPENTDAPDKIELNVSSANTDPTILPWLEKLEEEIRVRNFSGTDLIERLKAALAANIRNALYERVSRLIFGTQLLALRRMASSSGLTTDEVKEIYAEHVKRLGENIKSDYVSWIGFLEGNELVEYASTKFVPTPTGLLYLDFARNAGISEAKFG